MNYYDMVIKTSAGVEELKARSGVLPQRLRSLLVMIDGSRSSAQLHEMAARVGAPPDGVQRLEALGFIAPATRSAPAPAAADEAAAPAAAPAAPAAEAELDGFRAAQKFMNDSVVDALGLRAFFFTLKLERCFTRADLAQLLPAFASAMTKGHGATRAREAEAKARRLLA